MIHFVLGLVSGLILRILQIATDPNVVQWSVYISMAALGVGYIRAEFCGPKKKRKPTENRANQGEKLENNNTDKAVQPTPNRYYYAK